MPTHRNRNAQSFAAKIVGLAIAAPQVIAHRLARMAASGLTPSERDRKEFQLMSAEKVDAVKESLNAMALQTIRTNQALAAGFFRSFWAGGHAPARIAVDLQNGVLGILNKGIAPAHRKATANAKRLARTKRR